jgi:acetyl esterase/lipase
MGIDPERVSPYHHVESGAPPALIFHGKDDTTVPFATAEAFASLMKEKGNRCEPPHGTRYGRVSGFARLPERQADDGIGE